LKNDEIEENLDRYYDIPIKNKKPNYNHKEYYENQRENKTTNKEYIADGVDMSKHRIIEEILKENYNKSLNDSLNRPFTPPFNKFNNFDYEEKHYNNKSDNEEIVSNTTGKVTLDDKYKDKEHKIHCPKEELVYDYVLECYYHPQTNIYYELQK
jgi:hypothetical protein